MTKVYNPYPHSVPLPINGEEIMKDNKVVGYKADHVALLPKATLNMKGHTLHASALTKWPRLVLIDVPAPVAPQQAKVVEAAVDATREDRKTKAKE